MREPIETYDVMGYRLIGNSYVVSYYADEENIKTQQVYETDVRIKFEITDPNDLKEFKGTLIKSREGWRLRLIFYVDGEA